LIKKSKLSSSLSNNPFLELTIASKNEKYRLNKKLIFLFLATISGWHLGYVCLGKNGYSDSVQRV